MNFNETPNPNHKVCFLRNQQALKNLSDLLTASETSLQNTLTRRTAAKPVEPAL